MSVGPMLPTLDPGHSKQKQLKAGANYGNHDIVQCSCGQAMTYGTSTELEKLFTFERTGSILCFTLHTAFPYSSAMSRLCCPDPELFARYCNNELATDLCLKSSSQDSACHSVCSALLQTYSDQLAGFAKIKLATAADASSTCKTVLVLEGAQPGALKVFVGAMYGSSMKEALCPSPDNEEDPPVRLVDLMELYSFGHKYNIGQMDPALCDIITTHVQKLAETSCMSDAVEFYNSIPEDLRSHPLQDAILQILVYMHKNWSCGLMDIDIRIHPRHVNVLLEGCSKAPRDALALLEHCVSQEEPREGLWDLKLSMSLTVNDSLEDIDLRHIDRWFSFKNSLPTSEFRIGVGEWCEKVQHLFCIKMVEERAAYRNYIQARNPLKRVKVVAGQLQIG